MSLDGEARALFYGDPLFPRDRALYGTWDAMPDALQAWWLGRAKWKRHCPQEYLSEVTAYAARSPEKRRTFEDGVRAAVAAMQNARGPIRASRARLRRHVFEATGVSDAQGIEAKEENQG